MGGGGGASALASEYAGFSYLMSALQAKGIKSTLFLTYPNILQAEGIKFVLFLTYLFASRILRSAGIWLQQIITFGMLVFMAKQKIRAK